MEAEEVLDINQLKNFNQNYEILKNLAVVLVSEYSSPQEKEDTMKKFNFLFQITESSTLRLLYDKWKNENKTEEPIQNLLKVNDKNVNQFAKNCNLKSENLCLGKILFLEIVNRINFFTEEYKNSIDADGNVFNLNGSTKPQDGIKFFATVLNQTELDETARIIKEVFPDKDANKKQKELEKIALQKTVSILKDEKKIKEDAKKLTENSTKTNNTDSIKF